MMSSKLEVRHLNQFRSQQGRSAVARFSDW